MINIRFSGNYIRLSIMMFLEFFVMGSTGPVISLYLKDQLCFTGSQTGYIIAASAVSSLFSPIIGALVADRIISSERLLALVHFLGAAAIYLLSTQTEFYPIFFLYLVYWLLIGPSVALTTAITFHHLGKSNNFGTIRLWGTIGWIAA
ncbi:MAG: MFS transporter, partial [Fibrobacter sp.]|nr:MFS transporter [Fibrobacter sp.]